MERTNRYCTRLGILKVWDHISTAVGESKGGNSQKRRIWRVNAKKERKYTLYNFITRKYKNLGESEVESKPLYPIVLLSLNEKCSTYGV